MFRFHVLGLPHTQTHKRHNACAYTMKVFNFCKMMTNLGHTVFHYGAEESNPPCTEHINVISAQEQKEYFGNFDYKKQTYDKVFQYNSNLPYWKTFNTNCIKEINIRQNPKDFLAVIAGHCQRPVSNGIAKNIITVEYGVGYTGTFSKYRAFESYSHMHKIWGRENIDKDGDNYDVVIPNYYDINDFQYYKDKKDYYLYVGRLIRRKGISIAVETTKCINAKLKIAGQGALFYLQGKLLTNEEFLNYDNMEFVGHVNVEQRAKLMGEAKALFVPTIYVEPFGGVAVEAQLCGTPVITSDWGAFSETVEHGKTGYRCRTLDHYVWAAQNVDKLDTNYIRERAIKLYSLEKAQTMYQEWFEMIYDTLDKGWFTIKPRSQLDWLNKF